MGQKPKKINSSFMRLLISVLIFFVGFMFYEKKHSPETYDAILSSFTGIFSQKEPPEEIEQPIPAPLTPLEEENAYIIDTETNSCTLIGGPYHITYYNQNDARWKDKIYGKNDTIGTYGCGPTVLAMIVSSLTETKIAPDAMSTWAYENNFFCEGSGSYHSIIPQGSKNYGLQVTNLKVPTKESVIQELSTGKVLVALMRKGQFTSSSGHFIIIRSVNLDGTVLIADPKSLDNSMKSWDIDLLLNEFKANASSGGPVWSISAPNT